MSFGFSVGDFITILDHANNIRLKFVGAPAQFKALSDEVRNLTIVVNDVKIDLSNVALSSEQQQQLQDIHISCSSVLTEIEETINRYSPINASRGLRTSWKRLIWDPDDVRDLRNRLCSNIGLLNAINGRITRNGILELLDYKCREQDQKCLDWLSSTKFALQQSDLITRRHQGTGEWLLDSFKYQTWIKNKQATFFCPGIPGSGKSVLASIVINDLETRFGNDCKVGIAYIFCNFELRDDQMQRPESLLVSILQQLAQNLIPLPKDVLALYDKHRTKGTRPSFNETSMTLQSVVSQLDRVFVVIDALDECDTLAISRVLDEIFEIQQTNKLNLLATSRYLPEIMARFHSKLSLIQEVQAAKPDVMAYLHAELKKFPAIVSRNQDLQQEIANKITDAVDGMFLLAKLSLNSLRTKRTARTIKRELNELARGSQTYDNEYDKAMKRIQSQHSDRDMAMEVLSWVACVRRPLSVLELLHALAVELGESEFHEDNLPDLDDILSACAGLITVTSGPSGDKIRLVHYTTKEYFEREWARWFSDAHNRIATICVTYLSFDVFQDGICPSDTDLKTRLDQYPLYSYAAKNWGHHARTQPVDEELLMAFLRDTGKVIASVQELFALNGFSTYGDKSQSVPLGFTGLHLAAYFGLEHAVQPMIQRGGQSDTLDSASRTPLGWAVYAGHGNVVKVLLDHCVDAHGRDWEGRTPMSLAASVGSVYSVDLLLDHGIDPNSRDIDDQTPLTWASYRGYSDVVQLLVKRGANPDHRDGYGRTPLSWAATGGWPEIVQFLLEQPIDKDFKDKLGRTPLSWAAEGGHVAVVGLLLNSGAQLDSKDAEGQTPLSWASSYGHKTVLRILRNFETDLSPSRKGAVRENPDSIPKLGKSAHRPRFRCPLCDVQHWLPLHILRRHVNDRHCHQFSYSCIKPSCKFHTLRLDKLQVHCQSNHGTDRASTDWQDTKKEHPHPKQCPLCQKNLSSWNDFHDCVLDHAKDLSSG